MILRRSENETRDVTMILLRPQLSPVTDNDLRAAAPPSNLATAELLANAQEEPKPNNRSKHQTRGEKESCEDNINVQFASLKTWTVSRFYLWSTNLIWFLFTIQELRSEITDLKLENTELKLQITDLKLENKELKF